MNKKNFSPYLNQHIRRSDINLFDEECLRRPDEMKKKESYISLMNRRPIAVEYTFNLSDIEYEQDKALLMFLETLRNATSQDIIKIYCASNGGAVFSALRILNAMDDSDALIVTIGDSYVHSAASLILLSGDIIEVKGYCNMLLHDVSSMLGGKSSTMEKEIVFQKSWKMDIFKKCYSGFLTTDEITLLSEGKDYNFQSEEILPRLHNMAEYKMKNENREIIIYDRKKMEQEQLQQIQVHQQQLQQMAEEQNKEEKPKKTKKKVEKKVELVVEKEILVEFPPAEEPKAKTKVKTKPKKK